MGRHVLDTSCVEPVLRRCDRSDCERVGEYPAPRSRLELRSYYWFCLDHVRQYNSGWDYFVGMSQEEIESYHHGNAYWHRPTWRVGARTGGECYGQGEGDVFGLFDGDWPSVTNGRSESVPPLRADERQALAQMNLDWPITLKEIKHRYKELVKRHHPDTNGGDKEAEERLKTIIQAYTHLLSCHFS